MSTLNLYTTQDAFLPDPWCQAAGIKEMTLAELTVAAPRKVDVAPLLASLGWGAFIALHTATRLSRQASLLRAMEMRHETGLPPTLPLEALHATGLFPDRLMDLAAWFWTGTGDKDRVYRVTPNDLAAHGYVIEPIARFRRESGEPLYVETLNPATGPCPRCDDAEVYTFDPAPPSTDPTHHVCQSCELDFVR